MPGLAWKTHSRPLVLSRSDEGAIREAFWKVAQEINRRVDLLVALPLDKLDALRLEGEIKAIANDPNQKATGR